MIRLFGSREVSLSKTSAVKGRLKFVSVLESRMKDASLLAVVITFAPTPPIHRGRVDVLVGPVTALPGLMREQRFSVHAES